MRSTAFTIFLLIVAGLLCGLAGWSLKMGNLHDLLGAPLTTPGQRLYQDFRRDDVTRIQVRSGGLEIKATKKGSAGWVIEKPWSDRMDPRAAVSIIDFTLGLRVEDSADIEDISQKDTGLKDETVGISLFDEKGNRLSHYRLGRRTPWQSIFEEGEPPIATVFIRTRDANRGDHAYICTGDITPLFKDGMKFLRDHRPFYFNPIALQKIRIRSEHGELSIGREHPSHPWRIFKPLDLPTDPAAVKLLLEKLYELHAVTVSDRATVTLPSNGSTKTIQIGITNFGSDVETLLEIHAPESEESRNVLATISDRPDTVFSLPLKPEAGLVSIADLPLSVNELRDPTLTNLNIASLQGISIRPITGKEILLTRMQDQPWKVVIEGREHLANEQRLFELLKAVTEGRAIGFETDAATDLSPWGLDRPVLVLRMLGGNNQALELNFGLDGKGGIFVQRTGAPSVIRVDAELLASISVRPYEWRHARLWSLSKVDLMAIERTTGNDTPLLLRYNDIDQSWRAQQDQKDISAELIQTRANFLLDHLEGLATARWLAPDDQAALTALVAPTLAFEVVEKEVDDFSDLKGIKRRRLEFAPATAATPPPYYFGKMSGEPNLFLIDHESFLKLSLDLMEKD